MSFTISRLPVDLEVRYCRKVQQPTQVQQPTPRGILASNTRTTPVAPLRDLTPYVYWVLVNYRGFNILYNRI